MLPYQNAALTATMQPFISKTQPAVIFRPGISSFLSYWSQDIFLFLKIKSVSKDREEKKSQSTFFVTNYTKICHYLCYKSTHQ